MSNIYAQPPNFKEIAKRENNFNYSVASLGDIYRPYLESKRNKDNMIFFPNKKCIQEV